MRKKVVLICMSVMLTLICCSCNKGNDNEEVSKTDEKKKEQVKEVV